MHALAYARTTGPDLEYQALPPGDETPCEVKGYDDAGQHVTWWPGHVRAWARRESGWFAHVVYQRDAENYPDCLPATEVRKAEPPTRPAR